MNFLLCAVKLHCLCHSWRFYSSFFFFFPGSWKRAPLNEQLASGITPGLFSLSNFDCTKLSSQVHWFGLCHKIQAGMRGRAMTVRSWNDCRVFYTFPWNYSHSRKWSKLCHLPTKLSPFPALTLLLVFINPKFLWKSPGSKGLNKGGWEHLKAGVGWPLSTCFLSSPWHRGWEKRMERRENSHWKSAPNDLEKKTSNFFPSFGEEGWLQQINGGGNCLELITYPVYCCAAIRPSWFLDILLNPRKQMATMMWEMKISPKCTPSILQTAQGHGHGMSQPAPRLSSPKWDAWISAWNSTQPWNFVTFGK